MADEPLPIRDPRAVVGTRPISRGRMTLLFMVMLVTAAGNTAMQSVMPSIGTELGVADVWISLAYTWSALLWVICAPRWAKRSDRRGRKAMMAVGLGGFILSFGLCGAVVVAGLEGLIGAGLTLALFAAARSLYGGFGSAAPPAVQAYVASRTPREDRTSALALLASSFGLGTVIGPAVAPLLIFPGSVGLAGPFFVFMAFGLAVLVALRWRLPDDDPAFAARGQVAGAPFSASAGGQPAPREAEQGVAEPGEIPDLDWRDRRLRPWLVAGLVGGHAQAALLGIAGFFVLDRLGLRADPGAGAGPIGTVLMAGAGATLLAQWGLIPHLRLSPRTSVLWGMALALVGTIAFALAYDLHTIALGFALASLGFGLYRPGFTAGASLAVSRAEQGQVGGITASLNGAAYIFAPALGVWLYNHHEAVGFAVIGGLCAGVLAWGWHAVADEPGGDSKPDAS
ncbi:MFS transporter [Qipengyuania sediminis]|uniref:MFS transporter n=1 Tax=Qipengyuania sediminis TaxID=1532023 RepID=UPI001F10BE25|nr:MFS transporter [Qipengyuania sediminis]